MFRGDRNLAAYLVSHDLAEAVRLGDRILVMSPSPSRIVHQWESQLPPVPEMKPIFIEKFLNSLPLLNLAGALASKTFPLILYPSLSVRVLRS